MLNVVKSIVIFMLSISFASLKIDIGKRVNNVLNTNVTVIYAFETLSILVYMWLVIY